MIRVRECLESRIISILQLTGCPKVQRFAVNSDWHRKSQKRHLLWFLTRERTPCCRLLVSMTMNCCSRNGLKNPVTHSGRLQKVHRHLRRNLSMLGPLSDSIEILAFVLSVEVYKSLGMRRIPPNLTQKASVRSTHQLLADDIEAV